MTTKAKEKPIIFSTPLIPAIQNLKPDTWPPEPIDPGKPWKWQTRRVIKPQPPENARLIYDYLDSYQGDGWAFQYSVEENGLIFNEVFSLPNTGKGSYPPGTRLWVKETWCDLRPANMVSEFGKQILYKSIDGQYGELVEACKKKAGRGWQSPRFMPKAAARLWLEVKNVRVERIKEISNEDILAEGINDLGSYGANYDYFANEIWNPLNAKRGYPWENNDWVWVYEFMRTNKP